MRIFRRSESFRVANRNSASRMLSLRGLSPFLKRAIQSMFHQGEARASLARRLHSAVRNRKHSHSLRRPCNLHQDTKIASHRQRLHKKTPRFYTMVKTQGKWGLCGFVPTGKSRRPEKPQASNPNPSGKQRPKLGNNNQ